MTGAYHTTMERLKNHALDLMLGIETSGKAPGPAGSRDGFHYAANNYSLVRDVIGRLALTADDTFFDIGCGKGRVLSWAARQHCREVVGIEYEPGLAAIAERNIGRLRGRIAPVRVVTGAAESADYGSATVAYFFCPFGAPTLEVVLDRFHTQRRQALRLAFVNPSADHDAVFGDTAWLEPTERWTQAGTEGHDVAFYASRD
jgi:SAM-dependent methyltransferase